MKCFKVGAPSFIPFLVLLAGCSGKNFEFAEVEGKVTLNNHPLVGALVKYYPIHEGREQLPVAMGMTDDAGMYNLARQGDKAGALVGPNRVVVAWPSRDMRAVLGKDGKPAPAPSAVIPLEYTTALETPLKVEVKAGGRQNIDLPLTD